MTQPLRILLVEGNTAVGNQAMAQAGLGTNSEQYAAAVRRTAPDADIHIVFPADGPADLPGGVALGDFNGAILGGSGLFVRASGNAPEVQRQVDLIKAVFHAGLPLLGSCWGLQVAVVAAGGDVAPSPNGREVGLCRDIEISDDGRTFPLFGGKPAVFDSLAIHYDEVTHLPPGAQVLASNRHSPIQAARFTFDKGEFWGVQYHPEFTLEHMAGLIRRYGDDMVDQGIYPDRQTMVAATDGMRRIGAADDRSAPDVAALAAGLGVGEVVADPAVRCREIDNWLHHVKVS